ncbi:hypothetical protein [Pannonibacter carbonis]|uniref:hypothetical protein n=1 Tax=Pannonibacter carbonis TaxID=2067569 RepID=UPI001300365D|nr:hypothetical protein [Pannonibacter carbonis]
MAKPSRPSLLGSIQADMASTGGAQISGAVVPMTQQAPTPPKTEVVKSTVYLPPLVHRKLKEIAFAKDCKIHDLLMEGVTRILVEHGHPSVDELRQK